MNMTKQVLVLRWVVLTNHDVNNVDLGTWTSRASLAHWGRVTHICVSKLTIIGSDNGLSHGRCQVIIWTNAGILWIGHLGTYFSEILIELDTFPFKKMHLKCRVENGDHFVSASMCYNVDCGFYSQLLHLIDLLCSRLNVCCGVINRHKLTMDRLIFNKGLEEIKDGCQTGLMISVRKLCYIIN